MFVTEGLDINSLTYDEFEWEFPENLPRDSSQITILKQNFSAIKRKFSELKVDSRNWFKIGGDDGADLFVKIFRYDSLLKRFRYTLTRGQARIEWNHILQLNNSSVPVPSPVAIGERFQLGLLRYCVFVTEWVKDNVTLRSFIQDHYKTPEWTDIRSHLWKTLANVTTSLFHHGFYHQDYHPQNILVQSRDHVGKGKGDINIWITDLHRAKWRNPMNDRSRMKMLAFLFYPLAGLLPLWECHRLYNRIDEALDSGDKLPPWSTLIEYFLERKRNHRRRRTDSCFEENDKVKISSLGKGKWRVYHDRSVTPTQVEHWLKKDQNRSNGPAEGEKRISSDYNSNGVVVRTSHDGSLGYAIKRMIGRSEEQLAWRNLFGMEIRDFDEPKALALMEPIHNLSREPVYFFWEWVEGAQSLSDCLDRMNSGAVDSRTFLRKRLLITELGKYIRFLHRDGIHHSKLSSESILVKESDENEFSFFVRGFEHIEFYDRPLPKKVRVEGLMNLKDSLEDKMSRSDLLRGWRIYRGGVSVPKSLFSGSR